MAEAEIVVEVTCYCWKHERVLGNARVRDGEPHVRFHHDSTNFGALTAGLVATGHPFRVEIVDEHVSLLELLNLKDAGK